MVGVESGIVDRSEVVHHQLVAVFRHLLIDVENDLGIEYGPQIRRPQCDRLSPAGCESARGLIRLVTELGRDASHKLAGF